MSRESRNLGAIAGHLYDIGLKLSTTNDILESKLGGIENELCLARRDLDILVGLSTPEIELLNREKELIKKKIDSYSWCFPDECVETRTKLDKKYQELEQSIQKAKNQLHKKIRGDLKNDT